MLDLQETIKKFTEINTFRVLKQRYLRQFTQDSRVSLLFWHCYLFMECPKITLTVSLFKLGDGVLYNLYVVSAVLLLCLFICQRQCSANTHWTLIVLISRGKMPGDIFWIIPPPSFFWKFEGKIVAIRFILRYAFF